MTPEIGDWSGATLEHIVDSPNDPEFAATVWGVPVSIAVITLEGVRLWHAYVYPPDPYAEPTETEPQRSAGALLDQARWLCRPYAPAAWDAYQLRQAQASGLQLGLFSEATL